MTRARWALHPANLDPSITIPMIRSHDLIRAKSIHNRLNADIPARTPIDHFVNFTIWHVPAKIDLTQIPDF